MTHQHQFLPEIEKILFVDNGRQVSCGSFAEILKEENDFVEKIKETLAELDQDEQKTAMAKANEVKIVGESVQENTDETKRSGNVSLNDVLAFLKANGSNSMVYFWLLLKLATHGFIVWFEICMSEFANVGEEAYQTGLSYPLEEKLESMGRKKIIIHRDNKKSSALLTIPKSQPKSTVSFL